MPKYDKFTNKTRVQPATDYVTHLLGENDFLWEENQTIKAELTASNELCASLEAEIIVEVEVRKDDHKYIDDLQAHIKALEFRVRYLETLEALRESMTKLIESWNKTPEST